MVLQFAIVPRQANWPTFPPGTTDRSIDISTENGLEAWVHWHYLEHGFAVNGEFRGFTKLKQYLCSLGSSRSASSIRQAVNRLRRDDSREYYFPDPTSITKSIQAAKEANAPFTGGFGPTKHSDTPPADLRNTTEYVETVSQNIKTPLHSTSLRATSVPTSKGLVSTGASSDSHASSNPGPQNPGNDLLSRKLDQMRHEKQELDSTPSETVISNPNISAHNSDSSVESQDWEHAVETSDGAFRDTSEYTSSGSAHDDMDLLLANDFDDDDIIEDIFTNEASEVIKQAPLFDESILKDETQNLLPQYGLIGSYSPLNGTKSISKLFLNTNVPFSAFICGVQGSGKSHTTSCIMENSLIASKQLGKLTNPLSALVFSYGVFGDGSGYNISEAAFLAAPHANFRGGAHVKKVQVFVSPSNYIRISKLYERLPNVSVLPFKLKPWSLDIDIMLTLMNVSESGETPLYMAQVQNILRTMATKGKPFNYVLFKKYLKKEKFNPAQENMLQIRLDILESFLDMDDSCAEPEFKTGEITILDMSCPFVDPNTACILFRIGLQRYLQSSAAGKMVVVDEAHKYMIKVPGAKALNESLLQTIRLQRHYGVRVVVSTQEPTLLTDLIALCSITVVHRFSSPEWFAAIKRHIPFAPEDREGLMQKIESLKTGTALLYSANAVLGTDQHGGLLKGTGRMIQIRIRKRVTSDGGQSVLAV